MFEIDNVDNIVLMDNTENECLYTLYKHTNKLNGKVYIGVTSVDVRRRWNKGCGYKGQAFFNAIEKYGWDNFVHEILADNLTKEKAEQYEQCLIKEFKSFNRNYGYNVGLGGMLTGKHSQETREKMSKSKIGIVMSEDHKRKLSIASRKRESNMLGKKHTEESKLKMSESAKQHDSNMLGKKHSEETKRKMSEKLKGNNRRSKKVHCGEIIFNSAKECAEYLNIPVKNLYSWIERRSFPEKYKHLNIGYCSKMPL